MVSCCRFEDYFVNRVKQLTFTFPEDSATSTGAPFWSAPKRFPKALTFVSSDPSYLSFVAAASYLRATTYGIEIPAWAKDAKEFRQAVDKIKLPEFLPKKGVKIETDEKATSMHSLSLDDDFQIEQLIQSLEGGEKTLPHGFHMHPISFEKVCACLSGFLDLSDLNYLFGWYS